MRMAIAVIAGHSCRTGNRVCDTSQHNERRAIVDEGTSYKILLATKSHGSTRNPKLPPPNQLTEPHEGAATTVTKNEGFQGIHRNAECCCYCCASYCATARGLLCCRDDVLDCPPGVYSCRLPSKPRRALR